MSKKVTTKLSENNGGGQRVHELDIMIVLAL
jgi:hypothetical protein